MLKMLPLGRYRSFLCAVMRLRRNFDLYSSTCGNLIKRNYHITAKLCERPAFTHSHHQSGQSYIRYYTPQNHAASDEICWNCHKAIKRKNNMICEECGHLQDVNTEINYFDLLECSQSFAMETQKLTRNFRQLQTIVHPDKYSNKSAREQRNSVEWSSLINTAYKTLLTPIERGEYLLQLRGMKILDDNTSTSTMDKEFLMKMMERNEEVEEAKTGKELQELNENIAEEINEKSAELITQFHENDLNGALRTLVLMKYLRSLQRSIKFRLEATHS